MLHIMTAIRILSIREQYFYFWSGELSIGILTEMGHVFSVLRVVYFFVNDVIQWVCPSFITAGGQSYSWNPWNAHDA